MGLPPALLQLHADHEIEEGIVGPESIPSLSTKLSLDLSEIKKETDETNMLHRNEDLFEVSNEMAHKNFHNSFALATLDDGINTDHGGIIVDVKIEEKIEEPSKALCNPTTDVTEPIEKVQNIPRNSIEISSLFTCKVVIADVVKNLFCVLCNQYFFTTSELGIHKMTHEQASGANKPKNANKQSYFQCNFCNKLFQFRSKLIIHLKKHYKVAKIDRMKEVTCNICNKQYKDAYYLQTHLRIHTNEKPFACDSCEKRFKQLSHLTKHKQRLHSQERLFSCNICNNKFFCASNLKTHKKIHLTRRDRKLHNCDQCGKEYTRPYNLKKHKCVHTEETVNNKYNQVTCQLCNKTVCRQNLSRHHQRFHNPEKKYVCKVCSKEFQCSPNLAKHLRIHGKGKLPVRWVAKDLTNREH